VEVQDFIQLAKNVRPCDKALSPVVIADHMYGHDKVADQHVLSGYYAALAAWHDVMAFNHANAVRHELIGNFENGTAVMQLMGSDYNLHMGAGFHTLQFSRILCGQLQRYFCRGGSYGGLRNRERSDRLCLEEPAGKATIQTIQGG
jgi:hypothetical protein